MAAVLGYHIPTSPAAISSGGLHSADRRVQAIDTVFVLTGGGPGISTETLTLYAYQEGLKKFNLGYTSFLIAVIILGTLYLANLKPHLEKRA